jgi:hypothetical protein
MSSRTLARRLVISLIAKRFFVYEAITEVRG